MASLTELLERAAGELTAALDVEDIAGRARRLRSRRRIRRTASVVVAFVVVVAVVVAVWPTSTSTPRVGVPPVSAPGMFPFRSDTVILRDTGDGVSLVDLDTGRVVTRTIDGQRQGDQPYRLLVVGNNVVVGWSPVYVAPLDGSPSRVLGAGTVAVPAAEPGHVWLVQYPSGTDNQESAIEVDLSGTPVHATLPPPGTSVLAGIPDGLVVTVGEGLGLWNAMSGPLKPLGPADDAMFIDAKPDVVAWCQDLCSMLHFTDPKDGSDIAEPVPGGEHANFQSARLSPDGKTLTVSAGASNTYKDTPDPTQRTLLIDTRTGTLTSVGADPDFLSYVWSPDGQYLFTIAVPPANAGTPTIAAYDTKNHQSYSPRPLAGSVPGVAAVAVNREAVVNLLGR
jgi:hypothetical protein